MFLTNPLAIRAPYPADLKAVLNVAAAHESQDWLGFWGGINPGPTPLHSLPEAAARLGVASLQIKDEAARSPLASFKALGAPIALVRLILRLNPDLDAQAVFTGACAARLKDLTVISATDGNHGRALAAAAQSVGCACQIVIHGQVSEERERAIAAYGAKIIRISGNYDESVAEAARLATAQGWHVVSDTSYEGYEEAPRDVMQGYAIIAAELTALAQPPITHVILQAGVGGFAAGIASYFWEVMGADRPTIIIVEPHEADCLFQTAKAGVLTPASGSTDSLMAGLACGETSPLAWKFLRLAADAFMTIEDEDAVVAMRALALGGARDQPLVVGECGAAGLAALRALRADAEASEQVGLSSTSRVLLINTEGATAPGVYAALVGETAEAVLARRAAWRPA
jgi:diaminopropionate ammonia-lyase